LAILPNSSFQTSDNYVLPLHVVLIKEFLVNDYSSSIITNIEIQYFHMEEKNTKLVQLFSIETNDFLETSLQL